MDYVLTLVLTFLISIIAMGVFFVILIIRGRRRGNLEYIIIQSYLGIKKPIRRKGYVKLDDLENTAIFEMADIGGRKPIGTFHQKYLMPQEKGYLMFLEQYEIGRYRPIEFTGETRDELIKVVEKDFLGNAARTETGEILKKDLLTKISRMKAVSNNDVDFILQTRTRLKERLLAKQKKNSLWRTLAIVSIYLFLFLSIFINTYYNHETSVRLAQAVEDQSEAKVTELVTRTILQVLSNQSIKDVVKPVSFGGG